MQSMRRLESLKNLKANKVGGEQGSKFTSLNWRIPWSQKSMAGWHLNGLFYRGLLLIKNSERGEIGCFEWGFERAACQKGYIWTTKIFVLWETNALFSPSTYGVRYTQCTSDINLVANTLFRVTDKKQHQNTVCHLFSHDHWQVQTLGLIGWRSWSSVVDSPNLNNHSPITPTNNITRKALVEDQKTSVGSLTNSPGSIRGYWRIIYLIVVTLYTVSNCFNILLSC